MTTLRSVLKLLVAVACVGALTPPPADARSALPRSKDFFEIGRAGPWTAHAGRSDKGTPMCVVSIVKFRPVQLVSVKWFLGEDIVRIHIAKQSWRIPRGTTVKVELGFDQEREGITADAHGGDNLVEFFIAEEDVARFFSAFREADLMWLRFPEGNETEWRADMTGSREIASIYANCVRTTKRFAPTQPYGARGTTQPYSGGGATQPYGGSRGSSI
jgi:hypothetical protein